MFMFSVCWRAQGIVGRVANIFFSFSIFRPVPSPEEGPGEMGHAKCWVGEKAGTIQENYRLPIFTPHLQMVLFLNRSVI